MRARDVTPGMILPDGRRVTKVSRTDQCVYIFVTTGTGLPKRLRYQPDTIMPGPDDRHPSRYPEGHPWKRYRASTRGWRGYQE
jgi:hypothetical protein